MTTYQDLEERAPRPRQVDFTALRSSVMDLEEEARTFIRQRPVTALLAALGAGYLVARLAARGRRWPR